ncbi:MAG: DCC1-like thiol-disulfide oxidoreductase family protein [Myxococcota bacterium]
MVEAPAPQVAPEVLPVDAGALPERLVLYDGVCGFCDGAVQWLLARDREARLCFAPLQGTTAEVLRARHAEIPEDLETFVVVERDARGERVHLRSDALLAVLGQLPTPWPWLTIVRWVPRAVRDAAYTAFATRRYRWFGTLDACAVPSPDVRARFLD